MRLRNKVVVVTGGAHGIGRALAKRFNAEGARVVVVVDQDVDGANAVAAEIGGVAKGADVSVEDDIIKVTSEIEREFGQIDLFCSNAGIICEDPTTAASTSNEVWNSMWSVNVMAHVYAARAALPAMLERGEGYFLNTVSAAGVLSHPNSAPYSTTKHAALGFAESLAIAHGEEGIGVSVICPQAVRTRMLGDLAGGDPHGGDLEGRNPEDGGVLDGGVQGLDGVLEPEEVAQRTIEALEEERFLVLPHPEVLEYMRHKASDYDRWLRGMRRLRARFLGR
jgi:NAD(P)-dependent dehydrogenase (short-subunit alcohol dehydrogenase family)